MQKIKNTILYCVCENFYYSILFWIRIQIRILLWKKVPDLTESRSTTLLSEVNFLLCKFEKKMTGHLRVSGMRLSPATIFPRLVPTLGNRDTVFPSGDFYSFFKLLNFIYIF
jgi:hypothetical protein